MTYPEIRIQDGWLIRESASRYLHELWGKDKHLATDDEMQKIVEAYKKAWQPYETKIMKGLCEVTGLEFYQNTVDVYIAPWFRPFSNPMVLGVVHEPDYFVDLLTHELIHRLITDNKTIPYETWFLDDWKKMFGEDIELHALIHIPVHAIHKAIYLDILNEPKRYERDVEESNKYDAKSYLTAWDYVEKYGYKEIIAKLKSNYRELVSSK